MFLSLKTKNLCWEILAQKLIIFERWVEDKDEKF